MIAIVRSNCKRTTKEKRKTPEWEHILLDSCHSESGRRKTENQYPDGCNGKRMWCKDCVPRANGFGAPGAAAPKGIVGGRPVGGCTTDVAGELRSKLPRGAIEDGGGAIDCGGIPEK